MLKMVDTQEAWPVVVIDKTNLIWCEELSAYGAAKNYLTERYEYGETPFRPTTDEIEDAADEYYLELETEEIEHLVRNPYEDEETVEILIEAGVIKDV